MTPTTTVTTTGNSVSEAPGPTATQSGIAAGCNNYAQAKAGDDCYDFANSHGITPAQLYQYNSILGPNGANCSLMFQAQVSGPSRHTITLHGIKLTLTRSFRNIIASVSRPAQQHQPPQLPAPPPISQLPAQHNQALRTAARSSLLRSPVTTAMTSHKHTTSV